MKINVTCKCGHLIEIEVFGKNSDRERKIKQTESEDCPECQLANRLARMNADTEWCDLTGSDKQIVWAHDIRKNVVCKLEEMAEKNNCSEQFKPFLDCLKNDFNESKFWIDNRFEAPQFFARAARSHINSSKES